MPAAAALLSPWTDLSMSGDSVRSNAKRDAMFNLQGFENCVGLYLGETDRRTPLASPVFGEFEKFPPLLIHVGEREMLRDDSARLARYVLDAGGSATLRIWPVVPHVWQLARFVPEARESMREMAAFLHGHTASGPLQQAA
jgi:acetyl esterase/lipase